MKFKDIPQTRIYEKGFTLVEVLVAISLSLILIFFIYRITLFTMSFMNRWYESKDFAKQSSLIYNRIKHDLKNQSIAVQISSQIFEINNKDIEPPVYKLLNKQLVRNDKILTLGNIFADSLTINFIFRALDSDSLFSRTLFVFNEDDSLLDSKQYQKAVLHRVDISLLLYNQRNQRKLEVIHTIDPPSFSPLRRNYQIIRLKNEEN